MFKNFEGKVPEDEKLFVLMMFREIEDEWQLKIVTLDDVRLILSKVYSIVEHPRSKKVVLEAYDGLEKVKDYGMQRDN